MKKIFLFLLLTGFSLVNFSCSETTEPSDNPIVKVQAQMTDRVVNINAIRLKKPDIQASTIDSIVIKDFRILLSRLKFQSKSSDSVAGEKEIKAGPFLLQLDSTGKAFTMANGTIPKGTYSKIKFELHRFSSSESPNFANDSVYKDFATTERYSVIIKGLIYENNTSVPFTFNGTVTANLTLNFSPEVEFDEGGSYTILLDIDPNSAFIIGNKILDPRIQKDSNDIDNAVKESFKSVKKI